jgi:type 1 glutamine amidotransferase
MMWLALALVPLKTLIVTGATDLPHHHWRETTPFLRQMLENTGRFLVNVIEEPRALDAAALQGYDVLIFNYNGPRWSGAAEQAIEDFVRAGKGLVTFHQSSYGEFFGMKYEKRWRAGPDPGWRAFPALLGASWKPANIGHAPRGVFTVRWTSRDHPISRGLDATFVANDELYHKLDLVPAAHVLATAYDDPKTGGTGKDEPVIWTVPFGKGRGVHLTLGHDVTAMYQSGFREAFTRAAEWAATGRVTLPVHEPARLRVLVATGGHSYPAAFYSLFEGWEDIAWSHATTQKQAFAPKMEARFDVLVLHDMYDDIGEAERANLRAFVEAGKGVVSIHHSIVDYTAWPWWYEEATGGKYFVKPSPSGQKSEFKEGVDLMARPARGMNKHPVMRGVPPLLLHDEVYRGMWHSPQITVLMETDHPLNDRPVVYTGPNASACVIYIQPGHSEGTMRNPGYRKLVHNAILWAGRRVE